MCVTDLEMEECILYVMYYVTLHVMFIKLQTSFRPL